MIIAQPSRPKIKRQRKNSPHTVQATTPSVTITAIDTAVLYPSDQVLPAFYVSPTGLDNNPGTEAAPFETIEAARDAMRSSSTTRTYLRGNAGNHSVTASLSLNSNDAGVEFLAYPTESPVIDGGNNGTSVFSITANGNNITINDLTFQNLAATDTCNFAVTTDATISNLTFNDNSYNGAQNLSIDCNGTQYYVAAAANGGDDANDGLSTDNPWLTIGKVNGTNFNAADVINFNGGDTFNDEKLTLSSSGNGTSGNPILIKSYGTGQATINGTSLNRCIDINAKNFIYFDNFNLTGTTGGNGEHVIEITSCNDITVANCNVTGNTTGTGAAAGIVLGTSRRFNVDNCIITDINQHCIFVTGGGGTNLDGKIQNCSLGTHAQQSNGDGDPIQFNGNIGNNVTIDNCTFDNEESSIGENGIDVKGGSGHVISNCTFVDTRQSALLVHYDGSTVAPEVTVSDCDFTGTVNNNGRPIQIGVGDSGLVSTVIFNRCKIVAQNTNDRLVLLEGDSSSTFNACAFHAPSGTGVTTLLEARYGSSATADNCTFIGRNGNTLLECVHVRSDNVGSGITLRNCIFDTDGTTNLILESDIADPFTLSNNLYESGATNWFDINGTTYQEVDVPGTFGGSNSTTGDPDFASEDESNDNYLLPNSGSPALDLGSNAFNPSTDLVGTSYDDPPNAGCREGNA